MPDSNSKTSNEQPLRVEFTLTRLQRVFNPPQRLLLMFGAALLAFGAALLAFGGVSVVLLDQLR